MICQAIAATVLNKKKVQLIYDSVLDSNTECSKYYHSMFVQVCWWQILYLLRSVYGVYIERKYIWIKIVNTFLWIMIFTVLYLWNNIHKCISISTEYVSFWFDAIHCYWSTANRGRLDPPIIVVCTKEDQFKVKSFI